MNIIPTKIKDIILLEPIVHQDQRGFFCESFHAERYHAIGINQPFIQDNISCSNKNVLRGLHYQLQSSQGKLIYAAQGIVFDVAVDIRYNSPTFGQYVSAVLSEENQHQIYIPEGFAHGFCVLSDTATLIYKCTDYYHKPSEHGLLYSDPDLAIDWPIKNAIMAEKDQAFKRLRNIPKHLLPEYKKTR